MQDVKLGNGDARTIATGIALKLLQEARGSRGLRHHAEAAEEFGRRFAQEARTGDDVGYALECLEHDSVGADPLALVEDDYERIPYGTMVALADYLLVEVAKLKGEDPDAALRAMFKGLVGGQTVAIS